MKVVPPIRLLADDLTGALDSAAAFASPNSAVSVVWNAGDVTATGSLAFDTATRERSERDAASAVGRLAPRVFGASTGALAYKKIDSLLRGPQAAEIGAAFESRVWSRCIVAPAFPMQRRITRGGRQGLLDLDGVFRALDGDLAEDLRRLGHRVDIYRAGDTLPSGIGIFDAECDEDLDRIVAEIELAQDVLFVGSGGLAAALARRFRLPSQPLGRPAGPVLALLGTNHPVTEAQLSQVDAYRLEIAGAEDVPLVQHRLDRDAAVFVTARVPEGMSRERSALHIAQALGGLARELDAPGSLLVSGGETLHGLCQSLGCDGLSVIGELAPGIPCSTMSGGRWSGTRVVSKSGAFGDADFFRSFLSASATNPFGAHAA